MKIMVLGIIILLLVVGCKDTVSNSFDCNVDYGQECKNFYELNMYDNEKMSRIDTAFNTKYGYTCTKLYEMCFTSQV